MGRLASLQFALNVPRFLERGRRMATWTQRRSRIPAIFALGLPLPPCQYRAPPPGPWQFWLAGQVVTVLSEKTAAEEILSGPTRLFRGHYLAPLLGESSPLLREGENHERARAALAFLTGSETPEMPGYRGAVSNRRGWPTEDECAEEIRHALQRPIGFEHYPVELIGALRRAALRLGLRMIGADGRGSAYKAACWLLDSVDTPALVAPGLRPFSRRWRQLGSARAALAAALDIPLLDVLASSGVPELLSRIVGDSALDAAISLLVGLADNPVMVAAAAVCRAEYAAKVPRSPLVGREPHVLLLGGADRRPARWRIDDAAWRAMCDNAVADALQVDTPVPLLLREATAHFRSKSAELCFEPGQAIAIDAQAAGLPFGAGPHVCPGAGLAKVFARAAVRVVDEVGLTVIPSRVRMRRVRLSYGIAELYMQPTGT